ncbi:MULTISPECIES: hypothetical protein [Pseudoalteromonas]|uniref:hypothetical protein n=1 Tax=Pseudoalteromonas TaxID=53246 RepID=UPI001574DE5C|nr:MULTISPECIES: hypothetical protein [Pseudoalteromonas]MBR8845641.1 hypothetical protein [Pseudoalteromonas sp. JC3]NSY34789.1 hypothetical protein [Pseudoalteromonas sp. JC28]QUI72635.1 hypothetical protein GSF13_24280 [Pseudoalteromonas sp. M8]UDM60017.1 hypothetical protein KIJ96_09060 [Pseudoalteromonas piscicida]WJE08850.1 hypothetical protein QSH61_18650 [Pseudoalteromonas sp. JC3]
MQKRINHYLLSTILTLLSYSANATVEFDTTLRMNIQDLSASNGQIFDEKDTTSWFTALDVSSEFNGIRVAATANWMKIAGGSELNVEVSEAYYDFTLGDWFASVGKKKLDWDVGYGFRPLDMFSPTDSLAVYTAVPPGAWMVVGDYFTETGSVSLVCNETTPDYLEKGVKVAASAGCGGRYYRYFESFEAQAVAHYDEKLGVRVGGSAVTVIGDSMEIHSSLLWQQRHRMPIFDPRILQSDSFIPSVQTQWQRGSLQALMGINYSFRFGMTLIAEYWYDGRSPSNTQWRDLIRAADGNIESHQLHVMRGHFATQNLFRDNLLLHLRTSSTTWQPTLTWVVNPSDNSMLIDGKLCYSGFKNSPLCGGIRQYVGGNESIYEQLSFDKTWYFSTELKF